MSSFKVLKVTPSDESLIKFAKEEISALGWIVGLEDIDCYLGCDPGVFVGILNDEPIGCVVFNKYSDSYCIFGFYFVKEKHRGKGYGMQMYKKASENVDWSQIVSAYAVPEMVKKYEERKCFKPRWICGWYDVHLSNALEILKALPSSEYLTAKAIDDVDQKALLTYDTTVFGYQRHSFILKWLRAKGTHAKVAVNSDGNIVGYSSARVLYDNTEGYALGPLFADSKEAAQLLLKALFEEMSCHGLSTSQSIVMASPIGRNTHAKDLMDKLKGKQFFDLTYISTNTIPNGCFQKWFCVTSLVIG